MTNMIHVLPKLDYDYAALKPHIDARTMEIHHTKHHQGYIDKLNTALEKYPALQNKPLDRLIQDPSSLPEDIRTTVINNGGGHLNHSLFWKVLSPQGGGKPNSELLDLINQSFSSFEHFQQLFADTAATRFGSGWAWLVKAGDKLEVLSTPNQDSPLTQSKTPLLGLDVWEHAYYLSYQNRRADYIAAFWHIVNWHQVNLNLTA